MNERERAEMIARAVDALIRGAETTGEPLDPDDNELNSLLEIASGRLQSSLFAAKAGLQYEAIVWRYVLQQIEAGAADERSSSDFVQDADELAEIIAMRKELADESAQLAESHREAVWEKVHSRIAGHLSGEGVPRVRRSLRRRSDAMGVQEMGPWGPGAPELLEIPSAHPRLATGQIAEGAQELARARVWARVTSNIEAAETIRSQSGPGRRHATIHGFALAAATVAILAFAIGPLPATGFADHPATRLVKTIGSQFSAREVTPPPLAALPTPDLVNGREVAAGEASGLAGMKFLEPAAAPGGLPLTSSRYYPQGISGDNQGIFVLTYASDVSVLTVYQEPSAGSLDLSADVGSTTGLTLSDGTMATLIDGAWRAGAGGLSWSSGADQTLVFERKGVRVIAELHGEVPGDTVLMQFADSLQ